MKRLMLLILSLALLAAACGSKGASSLGTAPPGTPGSPTPTTTPPTTSPSPTKTPTSAPPPTSSGQTFTFEVWFDYDSKLFVTQRTKPFTAAVGQAALDEVFAGPSSIERDAAVSTSIPDGLRGDITALVKGIATVDIHPDFYEGSVASVRLREAQVVYTLTQYSTIESVQLTQADANVLANPVGRGDFEDLLPPILVESPIVGEQVSNPVTISGTANVFEATVSVRILDENGNEIARTFTTATCGSGCWGDYSVSVAYTVDHQQMGSIEVLDYSAKDGSQENVISIPVILTP